MFPPGNTESTEFCFQNSESSFCSLLFFTFSGWGDNFFEIIGVNATNFLRKLVTWAISTLFFFLTARSSTCCCSYDTSYEHVYLLIFGREVDVDLLYVSGQCIYVHMFVRHLITYIHSPLTWCTYISWSVIFGLIFFMLVFLERKCLISYVISPIKCEVRPISGRTISLFSEILN